MVHADEHLRPVRLSYISLILLLTQPLLKIFGGDNIVFQKLPELVNRYLAPPDPIILHYTINPAVPPPERYSAWDVEIKMEDISLKSRMSVMVHASKESSAALTKMDEEVEEISHTIIHFTDIERTDCTLGSILTQLSSEAHVPPVLCRGPSTFYTDVA